MLLKWWSDCWKSRLEAASGPAAAPSRSPFVSSSIARDPFLYFVIESILRNENRTQSDHSKGKKEKRHAYFGDLSQLRFVTA